MKEDLNLYKISPEQIIINRNCKIEIVKKLKNKTSSLKNIKESIYVGIYKDNKAIGGFNLDIHIIDEFLLSWGRNLIFFILYETFTCVIYRPNSVRIVRNPTRTI